MHSLRIVIFLKCIIPNLAKFNLMDLTSNEWKFLTQRRNKKIIGSYISRYVR